MVDFPASEIEPESAHVVSAVSFFRPTPSWLSPGRSTSLYLPEVNCEKHATPSIGKAAKRASVDLLHSPYSCPSAVNHTKAKQTKTRNKNPPTKQTKRKQTPSKRGQLDSHELLMNSDSSLCAIIRAGHLTSNNNTTTRTRWPSRG